MTSRTALSLVTTLLLTAIACAEQNAGAGFDDVNDEPMDDGGSSTGGTSDKAGTGGSISISGSNSKAGSSSTAGKGGSSSLPPAGSGGKAGSGSGGKGGKGGSGGTGGTGGTDAAGGGDDGPTNNPIVGLSVTFKPESTSDNYDFIGGELAVVNDTAQPLDFASLKIRYYFTNEVATAKAMMNWAVYGPSSNTKPTNCTGTVVALPAAKAGADSYVELTCGEATGSLSAGTMIKISWKAGDQSHGKFIQTGDWSFMTPDNIVVIDNNNIVWGVEPS